MLTARMSDTKVWKTCMGAIANLLEEAHFKFTPEGVSMRAMDPSHVALVDFRLPAGAFEEYKVSKPLGLGLSLAELNKVLSRARSDDALIMEYDEGKNRFLITFKGASSRRFSLPLLDLRESELPEPRLQFTAFVEATAEVLQDGLRDSETVGENVRFEVGEEGFFMRAEGNGKSAELRLEKGSAAMPKFKTERPCSSMYSVKYLSDMLKAADPKEPVSVSLGQDLPIRLDLRIAGGKGSLSFILAPRIESE